MPKPPSVDNSTSFRMPAEWEPHAATWLAWPHYKLDWPGKFEPIQWVYAENIRYLSRHERVALIVKEIAYEKTARKTLKQAHDLSGNVRVRPWPTNRVWTRDSGCALVWPCGAGALARGAKARKSELPGNAGLEALRQPQSGNQTKDEIPESQNSHPVANTAIRVRHPRGHLSNPHGNSSGQQLAAIKWRFNAWAKYPNWRHDEKIGTLMAWATSAEEIQPIVGKNRVVLEGGSIEVNGQGTLI